jgi:hypothetical protein
MKKKSSKQLRITSKIRSNNMEIKTKFGPAAIIMDNRGDKIGIVRSVIVTVKDGDQAPSIVYHVAGNGGTHAITENDAIGLMPRNVAAVPTEVGTPVVATPTRVA